MTPSFARWYWSDTQVGFPNHTTATRQALAEAVSPVEAGRGQATRNRLVQHVVVEPTINEPWLRALVHQLR